MKYISANIIDKVPEEAKKWSAIKAQQWARKLLAGGPPDKPIDVKTGDTIEWTALKQYVGKKVRLVARPKGLILIFDDGRRQYIAGDTATSQKTRERGPLGSVKEMHKASNIESRIRAFAKEEISRYNKDICKEIRKQKGTATYEFWASGERISNFLKENDDISKEHLTFAMEQWGTGVGGYGKRILEYAVYFFDWKPDLKPEDPIFTLSETRIMNIIMARRYDFVALDHLVEACLRGPFRDLTDEQFKWVTNQSANTFPRDSALFEKLNTFGIKFMEGRGLSKEEIDEMNTILKGIKNKSSHNRG